MTLDNCQQTVNNEVGAMLVVLKTLKGEMMNTICEELVKFFKMEKTYVKSVSSQTHRKEDEMH